MRIVIVGSVAAGTSVGAKARRNTESAEIVIYERDSDVSYSGCGLPYYVGGEVESMDALTPRDPAWFATRYNIDIRTRHEVTAVDPTARTVSVTNLATGESFTDSYDVLVLATGVRPIVPDLPGVAAAGVFTVRNPSDARDDPCLHRGHRHHFRGDRGGRVHRPGDGRAARQPRDRHHCR